MRCNLCFKDKDNLVPVRVKEVALGKHVCKGCFYEIDKIRGWLEMNGADLVVLEKSQTDISKDPPNPPINKKVTARSATD